MNAQALRPRDRGLSAHCRARFDHYVVRAGAPVQSSARSIEPRRPSTLVVLVDGDGAIAEPDRRGRAVAEVYRDAPPVVEGVRRALRGEPSAAEVRLQGRTFDAQFAPRTSGGAVMLAVERAARPASVLSSAGWRQAREHFRQLPIALWTTDATRRITFALGGLPNAALALGDDVIGATIDRVVGSDSPTHPAIAYHVAALEGNEQQFRFSLDERLLDVRISPIRDERGRITGCAGAAIDVTEVARVESKLARAGSLLQATFESISDGVLVVDRDSRIARYNQRFLALWKLSADDVKAGYDDIALANVAAQLEEPDAFIRRVRELYADPAADAVDVLWFKDGRVYERYTQPQRLEGKIVGRVWTFRDVTRREQMLRRMVFLSDASYVLGSLDVEDALQTVARLAVRSIADGCAVDLFDGDGPRRLVSIARRAVPAIPTDLPRTGLSKGAVIERAEGCYRIAAPLESRGKLCGVITLVTQRGGRVYGDADVDVAEELARRASLAVENAHLYRDAKQSLRARDEFLSIAAHEIRGPLMGLHLAAQQLARARGLPPAAEKPLSIISSEDRRLARFVDELLDVAKMRAGQVHLELTDVDLGEVVRDVVARLASDLDRSGSSITIACDKPCIGRWDRSRLDQVVTNLLANAIKFGMGRPIEVRVSESGGAAKLVVRDHGIGIPADRLAGIFNPFERAVSARHYGGLGLGLYVVHQIVSGLGGTVRVESRPDEGSTFTVELPQARRSP
jgi:signal transduction histidine kinase/PAS domain-containing protein